MVFTIKEYVDLGLSRQVETIWADTDLKQAKEKVLQRLNSQTYASMCEYLIIAWEAGLPVGHFVYDAEQKTFEWIGDLPDPSIHSN